MVFLSKLDSRRAVSIRLFAFNAGISLVSRALQITVLVWVNQYLLRRIEPEEYSLYPIMLSILVLGEIVRQAFAGGLARFIVEKDAIDDHEGVTRIVSSMLPALILGTAFIAMAGFITTWQLESVIKIDPAHIDDAQIMLGLLVVNLCLHLLTAPYTVGPYVRQNFLIHNLLDLGIETTKICLIIAFLFGIGPNVLWLVVATVIAEPLGIIARVILTKKMIPAIHFNRSLASWEVAVELVKFGGWTATTGLTSIMQKTIPLFVLNQFSSAINVAAYHLGRLPDVQFRRLAASAAMPMQPALVSLQSQQGEKVVQELYYRGGRYHLWICLLGIAPLMVFAPEIIDLYVGPKYNMVPGVILASLMIYPFVWGSAMFYRITHAVGRVDQYYILQLIIEALALVAFIAAVTQGFGAVGGVAAAGAVQIAMHVFLLWPVALRFVNGSWSRFFKECLFAGLLPLAAATAACLTLKNYVVLDNWTTVGCGVLGAILVYGLVAFLLCLNEEDRELVEKISPRLALIARKTSIV